MRPPLSDERLEWRNDGRLLLSLKNVWKDGTHAITLEPHDLLVRLCAAIPLPWFNMVRYFGVLSSRSKHRSRVVPHDADPERFTREPASGDQLELAFDGGMHYERRKRHARPNLRECDCASFLRFGLQCARVDSRRPAQP